MTKNTITTNNNIKNKATTPTTPTTPTTTSITSKPLETTTTDVGNNNNYHASSCDVNMGFESSCTSLTGELHPLPNDL